MKHARDDYARIQDPAGKIPADEPVFLLRGQDKTAAACVRLWANMNSQLPDGDRHAIALAYRHANVMDEWPVKKTADVLLHQPVNQSTPQAPAKNYLRVQPSLGCATTGQLLEELTVRAEIHGYEEESFAVTGAMPPQNIREALARLIGMARHAGYASYRTIDENSSHVAVKGEAAARTPQP